jgi:hypothetical protein
VHSSFGWVTVILARGLVFTLPHFAPLVIGGRMLVMPT